MTALAQSVEGLFIEDDGWDVPCLWKANGDYPIALVRVIDVPGEVWQLIVAALATFTPAAARAVPVSSRAQLTT